MNTTTDLMNCYPQRLYTFEENAGNGKVIIVRPKWKLPLAKKLFGRFTKSQNFRIKLDDLGSAVWKNCDGKYSVKEIGEILGKEFGQEIEPIYDRLIKFILQLQRNKFIEINCPQ